MLKAIPYRYRVLALLCSLTTLTYLDRICISIVGVRIKSEFGLNNEQFGWVLASFALAYALFEIPSGILGDRIGPRAVFIRIVLWWSLFTAVTGFVNGLVSLLIVRFLFGMGEAGTYPNCLIVISRWFPANENRQGINMGRHRVADRICDRSADHCSISSHLRMAHALFCKRGYRYRMGADLFFVV
jgi:MFS family permease